MDKLGEGYPADRPLSRSLAPDGATTVRRIAHVVNTYLATSTTFIYTQLRAQSDLEQVVFARRLENLETFPLAGVIELDRQRVDRLRSVRLRVAQRLPWPDVFQRRMRRETSRFRPTTMHAHFGSTGVWAAPVAQSLGVPLLAAFHGRDVYVASGRFRRGETFYRELFSVGNVFTCVGSRARDSLVALGAPRERTAIVPVGIDLSTLAFHPPASRTPLRLLQISRLVEKKGVDLTLRAFAEARMQLPDHAHLSIVGDGPERPTLERLAAELQIGSTVTFHGPLSPERVRALIEQAHIGVQPSRVAQDGDQEGTPTVILEFQAVGVDVVATRHADIPEIVPESARLVPEEDVSALAKAIVSAASISDAERANRIAAGRELVDERHDAVKIAHSLSLLYDRCAEEGPRA